MTNAIPEVLVLFSECVVLRAFDELVRDGTPELDPFPPADPGTPAAAALSTGASHRVDDAGFRMVLDERTLTQALTQLRSGAAAPRLADVAAFELCLRRRLGPTIEPAPDDRPATFSDVVQYWDPDFIIAVDARVVARLEGDRAVFRPLAWIRNCIAVIR